MRLEDMPSNVARFEQLMYLSLGIGIVIAALKYQSLPSGAYAAFAVLLAMMALIVWLIARRHANWARWALLVIFLVGLVSFIPYLSITLQTNLLSGILSAVQCLVQGMALYLVFTGNAVAWFRRPSEK